LEWLQQKGRLHGTVENSGKIDLSLRKTATILRKSSTTSVKFEQKNPTPPLKSIQFPQKSPNSPQFSAKDSHVPTKEPDASAKELLVSAKVPYTSAKASHMAHFKTRAVP